MDRNKSHILTRETLAEFLKISKGTEDPVQRKFVRKGNTIIVGPENLDIQRKHLIIGRDMEKPDDAGGIYFMLGIMVMILGGSLSLRVGDEDSPERAETKAQVRIILPRGAELSD